MTSAPSETLNSRIQTDNGRHYGTPDGAFPSVTTILQATEKPEAKARLAKWKEANPNHEDYAKRGTLIHDICRRFLLARKDWGIEWGDSNFPAITLLDRHNNPLSSAEAQFALNSMDGVKEFIPHLQDHLERFSIKDLLWVEGPLKSEHYFTIGEDSHPRLWSKTYKYAGCPDIIGCYVDNELALVDIKSSDAPYRKFRPDKAVAYGTDQFRVQFKAFMKYRKAAMQIAAYSIAADELLGVKIKKGMVLVSTPVGAYTYSLDQSQLDYYKKLWLEKVNQYYAENHN